MEKIIETVFGILSPECRGLKIEKKGFDQITIKGAYSQAWLMGSSTLLQKVHNAGKQTILNDKDA